MKITSSKRQWEQEQQEQVDRDYEKRTIHAIEKDSILLVMTLPMGLNHKAIEKFKEQAKGITTIVGIPVVVLREGVTLAAITRRGGLMEIPGMVQGTGTAKPPEGYPESVQ